MCLASLYDLSASDLLSLEGYAMQTLSPSHPAERKESSPCGFDVPAGLGDHNEVIA